MTLSTPQELCTSRSPLRAQGQIALLIPKGTGGGNPPTGGGDTALTMQYQFDALGQEGILCGTDFQFYNPFPDTPATFDFGGWIANIALGVAVAAACVLATVLFPGVGAIGSAALIGAAMGALAVTATIAMEDMADGEVRNWKAAFGQTLLGTVAGAASGAVGWYIAPHGVATMSTFIKFGVLSGATMRVATGNAMEHLSFDEYMGHIFNPLSMVTDGLFGGLFGGATNYFRLGTAFPSQGLVNAYNASQAALQSMQAAGAASQADEAANGTKNSNPSVSEGGSKTNFDNETPRTGAEWNEYLRDRYGADNVAWNFNSVEDIINDPTRLKGYTADELEKVLGSEWTRDVYGSAGQGWKFLKGDISIFYHPGGGRHDGSYYGISTAATGKIKVVNPDTYKPLPGDKATIIYEKR